MCLFNFFQKHFIYYKNSRIAMNKPGERLRITLRDPFARASEFTTTTKEIIYIREDKDYIIGKGHIKVPKNKIFKMEKLK